MLYQGRWVAGEPVAVCEVKTQPLMFAGARDLGATAYLMASTSAAMSGTSRTR